MLSPSGGRRRRLPGNQLAKRCRFNLSHTGYDNLDRAIITENTGTRGVPQSILTSGFDTVGNRTSLDARIGGVTDFANVYSLDAMNRVIRIDQVKAAPASSALIRDKRIDLFYSSLSQYTRIDRYEDSRGAEYVAASLYAYDNTHRLTGLDHLRGATIFADNSWTFDAIGRITGQTTVADGSATLVHDKTGQLTSADFTAQGRKGVRNLCS